MSAKIITMTQQKGGTGKSLITIHLAFALERLGYRVGILDLGALSITSRWFTEAFERDLKSNIQCIASADWRLQKDIEQLNQEGVSIILIDTASIQASDSQSQAALMISDLSIIPFQPGILDEWSVDETIKLINQHRVPYRMLRNRSNVSNKPFTAARLMPFVLSGFLSDEPAYINALQSFETLEEVAQSNRAFTEIKVLAEELCTLVQPENNTDTSAKLAVSGSEFAIS